MTTTLETFKEQLIKLGACQPAIDWMGDRTLAQAWAECKRGDWMLWFLEYGKIEVSDKTYRLMAVRFARGVQHLMTDERSLKALDVAERYANGEATDEELGAARAAARDAAWDAAWAATGDAAMAAARAKQADIIREFIPTI